MICILFFLLFSMPVLAQEPPHPREPYYGLPAAYGQPPSGGMANIQHPASMLHPGANGISVFSEIPFGLKELGLHSLGLVFPLSGAKAGVFLNHSGYPGFGETSPGLAIALPLAQTVFAGMRLNFHQWKMDGAPASGVSVKTGWLFQIGKDFHSGFQLGLAKVKGYALSYTAQYGICWAPGPRWSVSGVHTLYKEQPDDLHTLLQYFPHERINLEWGFLSASDQWYLGIGFRVKNWRTMLYGRCHPYLGWTPGILWQLNSKNE